jgi:NAD-dependent dihydropyrimidine dehydrogenase PreA subunit
MIEIVSAQACIACDICVDVCPTDVFDRGADGVPTIARQADCQTCFMCEAYCPADALYVSPLATPVEAGSPHADEATVARHGLLGGYREMVGWGRGRVAGARRDQNPVLSGVPPLPEPTLPAPATICDQVWNHSSL